MEIVYLYLAFAWLVGLGSVINLYEEGVASVRKREDYVASLFMVVLFPIFFPVLLGAEIWKNK